MTGLDDGPIWFGETVPRILVVEDDDFVRVVLGRVLAQIGCVAIGARSGAEARTYVMGTPWDLVIVDVGLPDVNGLALLSELADSLREDPPSFIVLSGALITEDDVPEGCVILPKPFVVHELRAATKAAVDGARARRSGRAGD